MKDIAIVIKGAGEMASGIAHALFKAGMTRICMIEIENPLCVRRAVSFCEALFEQQVEVEGVVGTLVRDEAGLAEAWERNQIGVIADPEWKMIASLKPDVVVDAILAKKNLGTNKNEAPVVIAVGPGFSAPDIVDAVIESNRGPNLGRPIYCGSGEPYTGIPASRAGFSWERVLRAPNAGMVRLVKSIGDPVKAGDIVLYVGNTPVRAAIDGYTRGLIREIEVAENEKIGDIEPGSEPSSCRTISDKARAIGAGVLEAIKHFSINIRGRKAMEVKCPVCSKQRNSSMKVARHIFGTGDKSHRGWVNSQGVSFTDLLIQQATEPGNHGFNTLAQIIERAQETA
jgi:xanthine dehydrogenase accessory factor